MLAIDVVVGIEVVAEVDVLAIGGVVGVEVVVDAEVDEQAIGGVMVVEVEVGNRVGVGVGDGVEVGGCSVSVVDVLSRNMRFRTARRKSAPFTFTMATRATPSRPGMSSQMVPALKNSGFFTRWLSGRSRTLSPT